MVCGTDNGIGFGAMLQRGADISSGFVRNVYTGNAELHTGDPAGTPGNEGAGGEALRGYAGPRTSHARFADAAHQATAAAASGSW